MNPFKKRTFEVPCTVEVENSFERLRADVSLDGYDVRPGDAVLVHGPPIRVAYGERHLERRTATVTLAGPLERWWTRKTGDAEFMELLEFSFSSGESL